MDHVPDSDRSGDASLRRTEPAVTPTTFIVRLTVSGALIVAGLLLCQNYRDFFAGGVTVAHRDTDQPENPAPMAFMDSGTWTVNANGLRMAASWHSQDGARRRLESLPNQPLSSAPLSDAERTIVRWAKSFPAQNQRDLTIYRITLAAGSARVVTFRRDQTDRLCLAQIGWSMDDESWCVVEVFPAPHFGESTLPTLCPMPDSSQLLATRSDDHGQRSAEIWSTPASRSALVEFWRERNWRMDDSLHKQEPSALLLRSGAGRSVQIWLFANPADRRHQFALAIAVPPTVAAETLHSPTSVR